MEWEARAGFSGVPNASPMAWRKATEKDRSLLVAPGSGVSSSTVGRGVGLGREGFPRGRGVGRAAASSSAIVGAETEAKRMW